MSVLFGLNALTFSDVIKFVRLIFEIDRYAPKAGKSQIGSTIY